MRSKKTAIRIAIIGGVVSFFLIIWLLRFHAWLPTVGAAVTSLALLALFWPSSAPSDPSPLPDGVDRDTYEESLARLGAGAKCLRTYALGASPADEPLFQRIAELLDKIRAHHVANPAHARATRPFIRHALPAMLSQIADYMDLVGRSGAAERDRLAEISRRFEVFVPALERIDKACLDNDLTELEINVDVFNQQFGPKT